jgi:cytochrome c peroxidase
VPLYQNAFGGDPRRASAEQLWNETGRALRAFILGAVSRDAPFDRWNAGDDTAMSASAVRGLELFRGAGRCIACHNGPLFSDFTFHNVSSSPPGPDGTRPDEGRYLVTGMDSDRGAFLTPSLRQSYDTTPYFHDGSQPELRQLLKFFSSSAVTADPLRDSAFAQPLALTDQDVVDLQAFIKALRGPPLSGLDRPTGSLP